VNGVYRFTGYDLWNGRMKAIMASVKEPNSYELSRDEVELTYSAPSLNGSARFSFRDAQRKFDFSASRYRLVRPTSAQK
jgi:hypothetical protein